MNFKGQAFILAVIESLQANKSWTGKTHVQKALSLLCDFGQVEVPFQFVLYKHGPYSFDVESELEQMQSYGAITVEPNDEGYGVVLRPGPMADFPAQQNALADGEQGAIEAVCQFVGDRNVAQLERLATASWIRTRERISDSQRVAERLHTLKPHVPVAEAVRAATEIAKWLTADR